MSEPSLPTSQSSTAKQSGLFIVIEGIDGTGKSTQAKRLGEWLASQGREVVLSREPTAGPWGKKVRESAATGRLSPEEPRRGRMTGFEDPGGASARLRPGTRHGGGCAGRPQTSVVGPTRRGNRRGRRIRKAGPGS